MRSYWKSGLATVAVLGLGLCPAVVRANVYASGVTVDSSAIGTTCGTLKVTYVLNENADGDGVNPGVKIEVLNGSSTVVRTVTIARQKKGTHIFEWDGRDDSGARVDDGQYTVKITAADLGYPTWTRISEDGTLTNFLLASGVSVNKNPASPNYGKIYVSNSQGGTTSAGRVTGDGIYMLYADGADAGFATGGKDWVAAGNSSPFKSTIGPDDHLYVADFSNDLAWEFSADMSSVTQLIDASNKTANQYVESLYVEGTQAQGNRKIYTVDSNYYSGAPGRKGLIQYTLGANAAATAGDTGVQYIGPTYFAYYPRDVARDSNGDWYMNQYRASAGQAAPITKFLDGTPPINTAAWEVPKSYTYAYGIDLCDARGWVAYAKISPGQAFIFQMADGAFVTSFTAGSALRDVAFDAVGNLYTADTSGTSPQTGSYLRIWSPPDGPNSHSTTTTAGFTQTGTGGPTIITQPQDLIFCPGGTANLSVVASGSDPGDLTYQWKENGVALVDDGVNVIGANTANLTLNNVDAARAGNAITVVVCDQTGPDTGVVVSNPAILNVGVSFVQQPLTQTVCDDTNPTFTVSVQGVGTIRYQWQKDAPGDPATFEDIPDATTDTLVLTAVQGTDSGTRIRCAIRDDCNPAPADPVYSAVAVLTVRTGPTLTHVGYGGTISVGGTITMTCYASGTGILHYQWKRDGVDVEGATDASYKITNANCTEHSGLYSCAVTDDCGTRERSTDINGNPCTVTVGGVEVCGNGLDDDCDGVPDCEDEDCANDPNCVPLCPHQPFADADDDGDVDQADFGAFQKCFTGDVTGMLSGECYCFDRNSDGDVDWDDLQLFIACVSGPTIPANRSCDDYPTGDVVINEISYDIIGATGGALTDAREFVELYNRGTAPVDLAGWLLRASDTVAPPGDNNRDFIIPFTNNGPTWLNPGDYYVIGSGLVPNVDLIVSPATEIWENENDALELLDRNRDVRDTLIYNGYLGAVAVSPAEGRVWGRFETPDWSLMSLSRYLDGLDTNDNGRDFGLRPQTPGASNQGAAAITSAYVPPDVNGQAVGSDVAGLLGSFVNARVIDPTVVDSNNLNAIAASPQGGNAIIAWDPTGGGNSVVSVDLMSGNGSYDLWVYFDTNPIPDATPGAETSFFGIMGTTGTMSYILANYPDPEGLLLGDAVTANGCTGLAWVYNKNHASQTRRLYLVDAKDGGDSSPGTNSPQYWSVLGTVDLSTKASGWYRLALSYNGTTGAVSGTFDTQTFTGTTVPGLVGSFYIGYQENLTEEPATLRPPTFDLRP